MKIFRRIYLIYGALVFFLLFLVLFPFFMGFVLFNPRHKAVFFLNRVWAYLFFILIFMPFKVIYKQKPDPKKQYVFCANHFSFFDIPVMGINPVASLFVGKSSIARVPLFGYMYKKIHITLDRDKAKSRFEALERCKQEVDNGLSLAIFPEGGIVAKAPPSMGKFKDGAFKVAIEKQIPIVPVTIPFNWIILPDDMYLLRWHRNCIVFHEQIDTTGMDMNDLEALKEKTFRVIDKELEKYNKHEN